jgi:hypothetical protein
MSGRSIRRNSMSGNFILRAIEMIESPAFRVLSYIRRPGFAITVGKSKDGSSSRAGLPAWAELCDAGLPPEVLDAHILADGDYPGEAVARDAALRWKHEGHRVLIARPSEVMDFNDVLMGRARPNEGRAA